MKDTNEEKKQFVKLLIDLYSTVILSRTQAAKALNMSTATLDRMKAQGIGPAYIKVDTGSRSNNGKVFYPVTAIADYLISSQMMCA